MVLNHRVNQTIKRNEIKTRIIYSLSIYAHFIGTVFRKYKDINCSTDTIVIPTFKDILFALTKKNHKKTSISEYLVKVSYTIHTWLDALCCVAQLYGSGKENPFYLKDDLKAIMKLITYEYSKNNLDLESDDKAHCCNYTVNKDGACDHRHVR